MRHKIRGRKLGRNSAHRKALGRNIIRSLFEHGQIITTLHKAKEYAPAAEKMISLAKRAEQKVAEMEAKMKSRERQEDSADLQVEMTKTAEGIRLAYFRRALAKLPDKKIVQKLFYDIAPLFQERNGGYTQILHLSKNRLGDNARRAVLKLTADLPDEEQSGKTREQRKTEREKRKQVKADIKRKRKERKEKEKEKEKIRREKEKERLKKEKEKKKAKSKKKQPEVDCGPPARVFPDEIPGRN